MAGDGVRLNIFGNDELNKLFDELKESARKSIIMSAFRKASKPIINDAKSNLNNTRYTKVKKSLGSKAKRYMPILQLGARKFGNNKGNLAHLVNDGTDDRYQKRGKYTGRMIGNHFWDDALNSNISGLDDIIDKELVESFIRYIKRANNRNRT